MPVFATLIGGTKGEFLTEVSADLSDSDADDTWDDLTSGLLADSTDSTDSADSALSGLSDLLDSSSTATVVADIVQIVLFVVAIVITLVWYAARTKRAKTPHAREAEGAFALLQCLASTCIVAWGLSSVVEQVANGLALGWYWNSVWGGSVMSILETLFAVLALEVACLAVFKLLALVVSIADDTALMRRSVADSPSACADDPADADPAASVPPASREPVFDAPSVSREPVDDAPSATTGVPAVLSCPRCGALNTSSETACHACGEPLP